MGKVCRAIVRFRCAAAAQFRRRPRYDAAITAPRRKYAPAQRRRDLADAAVALLGADGARGLSHPRVDKQAGVPAGTTSFYYRTRKALIHAVAARITELDLADLSMLTELADDDTAGYSGTLGLARLVMLSGTEPYLTRTRARFEIILASRSDPELTDIMVGYGVRFYGLAHEIVTQWYDEHPAADGIAEQRALMVMTFISGVMTSFVHGQPVVSDAAALDGMIRHLLRE